MLPRLETQSVCYLQHLGPFGALLLRKYPRFRSWRKLARERCHDFGAQNCDSARFSLPARAVRFGGASGTARGRARGELGGSSGAASARRREGRSRGLPLHADAKAHFGGCLCAPTRKQLGGCWGAARGQLGCSSGLLESSSGAARGCLWAPTRRPSSGAALARRPSSGAASVRRRAG